MFSAPPGKGVLPAEAPRSDVEDDIYRSVQDSPEFQRLRRGYRGFAFPITAAFLVWYLLFIVLSTLAPALMSHQLFGYVNVALVLGLAQFLTTFGVCVLVATASAARRDRAALELRWQVQERLR